MGDPLGRELLGCDGMDGDPSFQDLDKQAGHKSKSADGWAGGRLSAEISESRPPSSDSQKRVLNLRDWIGGFTGVVRLG